MEHFIETWGYWAVFLGSLIEGESVILTAGVLASQGYLSLEKIIFFSFLGSLMSDQLLFFVGHFWGKKFLRRFPHFQEPADRAFTLLKRYDTGFILSFRFIYGIRIISPVIIGSAGVTIKRFAALNVIAAVIWAVASCCAGYFFGDLILNQLSSFWKGVVVTAVIAGFLGFVLWKGRDILTTTWTALKATFQDRQQK